MNSSSSPLESEDALEIVFGLVKGHRELSLAVAVAGLVIIVVFVAVVSVFCDRKCRKRSSWRAFASNEEEVTEVKGHSITASQDVESARSKDADAGAVESRQTGPSVGTVSPTVSEVTKQPLGKDEGTANDKSSSCGGNTETDKCQPNQSTPKDPTSPKETPKDQTSPKETPKDPISINEIPKDPMSPKETPKDQISPKESPKDPISINETYGQDDATAISKDLGAVHQSAVDKQSSRSEGNFNQVNDLNGGALKAIEDSLGQIALACLRDLENDEDINKTHGQSGPPQYEVESTIA